MAGVADSTLEDGEIMDSDDDETSNIKCESLGRLQVVPSECGRGHETSSTPSQFQRREPASTLNYRTTQAQRLGSDDSNSDSESEHDSSPKKRFIPSKPTPATSKDKLRFEEQHGNRFMQAAMDYQEKRSAKANTVWSTVINEQTLNQCVGSVSVEPEDVSLDAQERGVEHYAFHRALEDPRKRLEEDEEEEEGAKEADPFQSEGMVGSNDDSDDPSALTKLEDELYKKESFGTGFNERKYTSGRCKNKNGIKDRLGKRKRDDGSSKKKEKAKDRLGERSYDKGKHRDHIKVDGSSTPEEVSAAILDLLNEPDEKVPLFGKIVSILGKEKALELLYMTEDVEDAGGMMVMSGHRRRTPGGVYIQLMKSDKNVTKEQVAEIFREENEKDKVEKKKQRSKLRAQRHGQGDPSKKGGFEQMLKQHQKLKHSETKETAGDGVDTPTNGGEFGAGAPGDDMVVGDDVEEDDGTDDDLPPPIELDFLEEQLI